MKWLASVPNILKHSDGNLQGSGADAGAGTGTEMEPGGAGAGAGTEPAGIFKLGGEEAPGSSITQRIFPK